MNVILLVLSVAIYLSYGIPNFAYVLFSMLTSFMAAKHIKNNKKVLAVAVTINAAILVFVKLLPYTKLKILAPLGIAYYTLQVISYMVDVYKGKYEYEKKFIDYALYVMYIPHLFIGPITRYDEMKSELKAKRKLTFDNLLNGGIRVAWGLFKKLVIAGRISIIISAITGNVDGYNGFYALLAMLLYSVQLYSDFSGGIDIVLGVSKSLGINLSENFNSPFLAENIQEFWRRWHISLSNWLRDYIYIPLGGNRCSKLRKSINVLITFTISGLWHGVNYILWGIIHGIFVLFGDKYNTKYRWINRIINFVIVSILWSFFIWNNNITAIKMIVTIFTNFNIIEICNNILNLGLAKADWVILLISSIALFIFDGEKYRNKVKSITTERKIAITYALSLIILVFGIYGIGFNVNEFIYSKF